MAVDFHRYVVYNTGIQYRKDEHTCCFGKKSSAPALIVFTERIWKTALYFASKKESKPTKTIVSGSVMIPAKESLLKQKLWIFHDTIRMISVCNTESAAETPQRFSYD